MNSAGLGKRQGFSRGLASPVGSAGRCTPKNSAAGQRAKGPKVAETGIL